MLVPEDPAGDLRNTDPPKNVEQTIGHMRGTITEKRPHILDADVLSAATQKRTAL